MAKRALVTGGTRGIGAAIARELQALGFEVVANHASDQAAADSFADETGVATYRWDVSDAAACGDQLEAIQQRHGAIDVLINNAGITRDATIKKMTGEHWARVIEVNLTGSFNMAQAVLPGMRDRGWGRIVNIGSINGQAGQFGQVNYSAAKAGLAGFTKALAREVARDGVTVNLVAPGYTETDMVSAVADDVLATIRSSIPTGRFSQPDEIAWAVGFLCSERSGQITGSTLTVNGGHFMAG